MSSEIISSIQTFYRCSVEADRCEIGKNSHSPLVLSELFIRDVNQAVLISVIYYSYLYYLL